MKSRNDFGRMFEENGYKVGVEINMDKFQHKKIRYKTKTPPFLPPTDNNSPQTSPQIDLITITNTEIEIFPFFYQHYKRLGVNRFLIGIHYGCQSIIPYLTQFNDVTVAGISPTLDYDGLENKIRKQYIPDDRWNIIADLDEFHDFLQPLQELIKELEFMKINVYYGKLIDRIKNNGSFPICLDQSDIYQQFPLQVRFSELIMKGCCDKIMLLKGKIDTNRGHHHCFLKHKHSTIGIVNHIKWFGNVLNKLEKMKQIRIELKKPFVTETIKAIKHIKENRNRINPSGLLL